MPTFSTAKTNSTRANQMTRFQESSVFAFPDLAFFLTAAAWSPVVWKAGQRLKANFLFSDLCALDFDDGRWTVAHAIQMLEANDTTGMVGLTKSHQKSKDGQPAVDRFRVIMPWSSRITDLATYEQNMARLMSHMPVDKSCKDGGRFFWPCTEIVYQRSGEPLDWLPYQAPAPRKLSATTQIDRELHQVPQWMAHELTRIKEGERNKTVFRFSIRLKERGWTVPEIVELMAAHVSLDMREITRTVESAYKY